MGQVYQIEIKGKLLRFYYQEMFFDDKFAEKTIPIQL